MNGTQDIEGETQQHHTVNKSTEVDYRWIGHQQQKQQKTEAIRATANPRILIVTNPTSIVSAIMTNNEFMS